MLHLKLASCMAENTENFCAAVASFIEDQLGIRSEYVTGIPWQEREWMFDSGAIQILWLCGLPYVHKADLVENDIELLAVPIPRGERYLARPVYLSDMVVRRDRPFQFFFDLRGAGIPIPHKQRGSTTKEEFKIMANLEGKKAPAFTLEGNDGKKHSLDDYKGKTVVLYFYPRDNTPGCTKEACNFRDLNASLKKAGTVVLGVSKDSIESHKKFASQYKLPFTLLSDPKAEVMKKYGAFGKKMMYGKEVQGTIRSTVIIGPKGDVLKHWTTVKKAESHPMDVLDYFRAAD